MTLLGAQAARQVPYEPQPATRRCCWKRGVPSSAQAGRAVTKKGHRCVQTGRALAAAAATCASTTASCAAGVQARRRTAAPRHSSLRSSSGGGSSSAASATAAAGAVGMRARARDGGEQPTLRSRSSLRSSRSSVRSSSTCKQEHSLQGGNQIQVDREFEVGCSGRSIIVCMGKSTKQS